MENNTFGPNGALTLSNALSRSRMLRILSVARNPIDNSAQERPPPSPSLPSKPRGYPRPCRRLPSSSLVGGSCRIMFADADSCREGVTYHTVRRVHVLDVPSNREDFLQCVGRARKHASHDTWDPHTEKSAHLDAKHFQVHGRCAMEQ